MPARALRPCLCLAAALAWLPAVLAPAPAVAHPHIWITTAATFLFEEERIVGVRLHWTFDHMFSAVLGSDFDLDRDGRFSEAESERATAAMRESMAGAGFFTTLTHGEKEWQINEAAEMRLGDKDGAATLSFTLRFADPLARDGPALGVFVHDPSYYIAFIAESDQPVLLSGDQDGCTGSLQEREMLSSTWGTFKLPQMTLTCGKPG